MVCQTLLAQVHFPAGTCTPVSSSDRQLELEADRISVSVGEELSQGLVLSERSEARGVDSTKSYYL